MTMLSWSVIEYKAKFEASGEFDHARELIKWGTDYILKTFNNTEVDKIICQVCALLCNVLVHRSGFASI